MLAYLSMYWQNSSFSSNLSGFGRSGLLYALPGMFGPVQQQLGRSSHG